MPRDLELTLMLADYHRTRPLLSEEEAFGKDPFQHGLTPQNQVVLEKFLQYAEEQGYIAHQPKLSDLLAPIGN